MGVSADADMPNLKDWVHSSMWHHFRSWTQEWVNAAANGKSPPKEFGVLLLRCPAQSGSNTLLAAESVMLETSALDAGDAEEPKDGPEEPKEESEESKEDLDDSNSDYSFTGGSNFAVNLRLQNFTQVSRLSRRGSHQREVVSRALSP